jgi:hypothetical protein
MPRKPKAESVPAATAPCDIEARRGELEAELWREGHTIGEPTSAGQLARADRIVELQRQLAELPPKPVTETGEAVGSIQIGTFLGSPWRPPPREPSEADRRRAEDPYLRFMVECGQNWE